MKLFAALSALAAAAAAARTALSTTDKEVTDAADFAMERLRGLSEYYPELQLVKIKKAESEKGVFHFNWFLDVTLELKGKQSEHELMVMKHLETDVLSFAIDEFPEVELLPKDKDPYANYASTVRQSSSGQAAHEDL